MGEKEMKLALAQMKMEQDQLFVAQSIIYRSEDLCRVSKMTAS